MKWKISIAFILIFFSACSKTGDLGEILKFYGDAKEDIGYSIAIANDGYFIAGQLSVVTRKGIQITGSSKKPGIIKTGFDGDVTWEKNFGGRLEGLLSKIIVLSDGSLISAGQVTDSITLQTDIFVVKVKADGSGSVEKTYSTAGNQTSTDILQTTEGFLLLGTTDVESTPAPTDSTGNKAGKKDILVMRIDNNLNEIVPPSQIGYPGDDFGAAIKPDISGGYIIVGTTDRYAGKGRKNDIFLLKINSDGSLTEPAIIGDSDDEYAADLEVLDDGYMVAGTIGTESETQSVFVTKIPLNIYLQPLFKTKIINSSSWSVNAMSRYKSSSFVLAGKEGATSQSKILIFVIDSEGNLAEDKERIEGSTGAQAAYDVISDNDGNIIAVGGNTFESNSLITLLKFRF